MTMGAFNILAKALATLSPEQRVDLANRCRVRPRMAHRCAKAHGRVTVRPFPWPEYILLCAGAKIDPVVGNRASGRKLADFGIHNPHAFAIAIRLYRIDHDLSIREAAAKFKVATVTLSRAENHKDVSVEPFLAICKGIKRHPFDFLTSQTFHGQHKVEQVDKAGVLA